MPIPEYVAPVLTAGGSVGLVAVILCFGPRAVRTVLLLLAGMVAICGDPEGKRVQRCLQLARILVGRDDPPPSPPSDSPSERLPEPKPRGGRGLWTLRRRGPGVEG
jgi:hypothetical protein